MSSRISTSYADYLKSEDWKRRRQRALYLAQNRCQSPLCKQGYLRAMTDEELPDSYRLEVHHLTYERLGHERPDDLIVLCRMCHCEQHDIAYEEKRASQSIGEALAKGLMRLLDDRSAA
jgi:hypothetical protein